MSAPNTLVDKLVVITGCDGVEGLGPFIARATVKRGFRLLATCFSAEGRDNFLESVPDGSNSRVSAFVGDLTLPEVVDKLVGEVKSIVNDRKCTLHALVNNAGVGPLGYTMWMPPKVYETTMAINFLAPVRLTYALLPMLRCDQGRIINITSVAGLCANFGMGPYSASKFALEAYSDVLRRELMQWGVRVSVVEPYFTATPLLKKAEASFFEEMNRAQGERTDDYGKKWAEEKMKRELQMIEATAGKPAGVVASVIDALISKFPQERYWPDSITKLIVFPLMYLPVRLADRLLLEVELSKATPAFFKGHNSQKKIRSALPTLFRTELHDVLVFICAIHFVLGQTVFQPTSTSILAVLAQCLLVLNALSGLAHNRIGRAASGSFLSLGLLVLWSLQCMDGVGLAISVGIGITSAIEWKRREEVEIR